jgi:hypothetical protein
MAADYFTAEDAKVFCFFAFKTGFKLLKPVDPQGREKQNQSALRGLLGISGDVRGRIQPYIPASQNLSPT